MVKQNSALSIRLPAELERQVQALAERDGTTVTAVIRRALIRLVHTERTEYEALKLIPIPAERAS